MPEKIQIDDDGDYPPGGFTLRGEGVSCCLGLGFDEKRGISHIKVNIYDTHPWGVYFGGR